ncbi:caspase domain-containing protein [Mycena galericulata]|nr:caspase domain-containing protein [Mycena galericulata]
MSATSADPVPAVDQGCEPPVSDSRARVEGQDYKALLIGIRGTATAECPDLKGPHRDVEEVQNLLIDCYNYFPADITTLIDDGIPGHVQPTRENILKAINDLVKDAKAGDHFSFLYCGHSMQIKSRSNSEEDGMDECLIPSDGVDHIIVDNDLNAALVLPLPFGCQLVAVLDTCHSGSLLDLKHTRCNRVPVPWKWRGKRNSEEKRRMVVRNNARLASIPSSAPPAPSPARLLARRSEINMNLTTSDASSDANYAKASRSGAGPQRTFTYRARTVSFAASAKENDGGAHVEEGSDQDIVLPALPGKFWVLPEDAERCESPIAMFACTGWCRDPKKCAVETEPSSESSNRVKAHVVSLASCKDSQITYEDAEGKSMTSSLVEILRRKPNQSLKDVLVYVSHAMHTKAVIRHEKAKIFKKKRKAYAARLERENAQGHRTMSLPDFDPSILKGSTTFPVQRMSLLEKKKELLSKLKLKRLIIESRKSVPCDMDSFQNPELASARPLDMESQWRM